MTEDVEGGKVDTQDLADLELLAKVRTEEIMTVERLRIKQEEEGAVLLKTATMPPL